MGTTRTHPKGLPPTGAAGGDLSGTYPNPTVDDDSHNHANSTLTGVPGDGIDTSAIHDDTAAEISALTVKATPVSGDHLLIEDSAAGDAKKRITVGSLPGGGDVAGPASSTDNAIARFDGTGGKTLQNSSITIDDSGNMRLASGDQVQFGGTSTYIDGVNAGDLTLRASDDLFLEADDVRIENSGGVTHYATFNGGDECLVIGGTATRAAHVANTGLDIDVPAGSTGPGIYLDIGGTASTKRGLRIDMSDDSTVTTSDDWIQFRAVTTEVGRIHSEVQYGTFTGGHEGQAECALRVVRDPVTNKVTHCVDDDTGVEWRTGMIVSGTGRVTDGPTIGMALPRIALAPPLSRAVMGVYAGARPGWDQHDTPPPAHGDPGREYPVPRPDRPTIPSSTRPAERRARIGRYVRQVERWKQEVAPFLEELRAWRAWEAANEGHRVRGMDWSRPSVFYNALGEGQVLVSDERGPPVTGEYVRAGRGAAGVRQTYRDDPVLAALMRSDALDGPDTRLHAYTVAKITADPDWSAAEVLPDGRRVVLAACTYHCG